MPNNKAVGSTEIHSKPRKLILSGSSLCMPNYKPRLALKRNIKPQKWRNTYRMV